MITPLINNYPTTKWLKKKKLKIMWTGSKIVHTHTTFCSIISVKRIIGFYFHRDVSLKSGWDLKMLNWKLGNSKQVVAEKGNFCSLHPTTISDIIKRKTKYLLVRLQDLRNVNEGFTQQEDSSFMISMSRWMRYEEIAINHRLSWYYTHYYFIKFSFE